MKIIILKFHNTKISDSRYIFVFPALQQSTSVDTRSKVDKSVNKQVDAIKV